MSQKISIPEYNIHICNEARRQCNYSESRIALVIGEKKGGVELICNPNISRVQMIKLIYRALLHYRNQPAQETGGTPAIPT